MFSFVGNNSIWGIAALLALLGIAGIDCRLCRGPKVPLVKEDFFIPGVAEYLTTSTELGHAQEYCLPIIIDKSAEFDERMQALNSYAAVLDRKAMKDEKLLIYRSAMSSMTESGDLAPVFKVLVTEYGGRPATGEGTVTDAAALAWTLHQRLRNLHYLYRESPKQLQAHLRKLEEEVRKWNLPAATAAALQSEIQEYAPRP